MSKYRRLQLFFQQVAFNQGTLAKLIVSVIALARQGNTANHLVVAVCVGDVAIPLFWHDLGHDGNSDAARGLYRERWGIETLFQKLKGHGFNLEESRLRGGHKAETLLGVLPLTAAWRHALGEWHAREVAPISLKSHGRKAEATFRRGLNILRQVFAKGAAKPSRAEQKTYSSINFKSRFANRLPLAISTRC